MVLIWYYSLNYLCFESFSFLLIFFKIQPIILTSEMNIILKNRKIVKLSHTSSLLKTKYHTKNPLKARAQHPIYIKIKSSSLANILILIIRSRAKILTSWPRVDVTVWIAAPQKGGFSTKAHSIISSLWSIWDATNYLWKYKCYHCLEKARAEFNP